MADKSCSPSDFSEGGSCDSGVLGQSDVDRGSVVGSAPGVSDSADTSAILVFSDNLKENFILDFDVYIFFL